MTNRNSTFVGLLVFCIFSLTGCSMHKSPEIDGLSKSDQLKQLQQKQILVPMWGWSPSEMALAAKKYGYEVVNQPQNSDIAQHARDIPIWTASGLKMLVRPDLFIVPDPFDTEQIEIGYALLSQVIGLHEEINPEALGYVIQWGMFGEGGFQWGYTFSEKARQAFNEYMGTPGQPLPDAPAEGQPGPMRWIRWLQFRAETLREFRADYVAFAKQHTNKLVGTWSEVYPTDNYVLNMGDAPGADFLFYDLSFGDVTCNQTIAFGECHGEMESFPTFEAWRDHELPLMAKAAGEGVIPIAFQFPMRCNNEVKNIAGKKQYCIDKIEDEYSLKIGPYIRALMDAVKGRTRQPQVALVYHSFAAAALPAGGKPAFSGNNTVMPLYRNSAKQIEASMHQMGVDMRVIPYEWLEYHDLSQYKLVIVPDPVYLPEKMRANLKNARRVLYSGEYLMAHRDEATQEGTFLNEFKATTYDAEFGNLDYFKNAEGPIEYDSTHPWMRNIHLIGGQDYPADQMFVYKELPADSEVIAEINNIPVIIAMDNGRVAHVSNRAFSHAWHSETDWLEKGMFHFLKNLIEDSGIDVRVKTPPLVRANAGPVYGSYGISGYIAWNTTEKDLCIELTNGEKIVIPKFGWAIVPE